MRNVVLITLESVRADHCRFLGYPKNTTPNLDKLARNGISFENAVTSGGSTPASLFSVHTGDYALIDPKDTNAQKWRNALSKRRTLAEKLKSVGYHTGAFVPNAFVSRFYGFDKGFQVYKDFLDLSEQDYLKMARSKSSKNSSDFIRKISNGVEVIQQIFNCQTPFHQRTCWEEYYDSIESWIKNSNEPFFLWIFPEETHIPYVPPSNRRNLDSTFKYLIDNFKFLKKLWLDKICFFKLEENEKKKVIQQYDNLIYYVDEFIGHLVGELREYNPIFIVHSDHGDGFGEHGFYEHPQSLYEELIHVPLVISGIEKEKRVDYPVSLRYLPSSLCDLLSIENDFFTDNLLNGNRWVVSKVFEEEKRKVSVRTKDWKFITGENERDELYNLEDDPEEKENLIKNKTALADELRKIVKMHTNKEMEKRRIFRRVKGLL